LELTSLPGELVYESIFFPTLRQAQAQNCLKVGCAWKFVSSYSANKSTF